MSVFTKEEDAILVQRLIQQKGVGLSGEAMYKRLEADYPSHTWQAWRARYVKNLDRFGILMKKEKKRMKEAGETIPSPAINGAERRAAPVPSPSGRNRTRAEHVPFDETDSKQLVEFLAAQPPNAALSGNVIYEAMAEKYPRHTAQAWRSHYVKRKAEYDPRIEKAKKKRQKERIREREERARRLEEAEEARRAPPVRVEEGPPSETEEEEEEAAAVRPAVPALEAVRRPTPDPSNIGPPARGQKAREEAAAVAKSKSPQKSVSPQKRLAVRVESELEEDDDEEEGVEAEDQPLAPRAARLPVLPATVVQTNGSPKKVSPLRPRVAPAQTTATAVRSGEVDVVTPQQEAALAKFLAYTPKGDLRLLDRPYADFAAILPMHSAEVYKAHYKRHRARIDGSIATPIAALGPLPDQAPTTPAPAASTTVTAKKRPASPKPAETTVQDPASVAPPTKKSRTTAAAQMHAPVSPRYQPPSPSISVAVPAAIAGTTASETTPAPEQPKERQATPMRVVLELSPEPEPYMTPTMATNIMKWAGRNMWSYLRPPQQSDNLWSSPTRKSDVTESVVEEVEIITQEVTMDVVEEPPPPHSGRTVSPPAEDEDGPTFPRSFVSAAVAAAAADDMPWESSPEADPISPQRRVVVTAHVDDDDILEFDSDEPQTQVRGANMPIEFPTSDSESEAQEADQETPVAGAILFRAPSLELGSSKSSGGSAAAVAAQLTPNSVRTAQPFPGAGPQDLRKHALSGRPVTSTAHKPRRSEPVRAFQAQALPRPYSTPDIAGIFARYRPQDKAPLRSSIARSSPRAEWHAETRGPAFGPDSPLLAGLPVSDPSTAKRRSEISRTSANPSSSPAPVRGASKVSIAGPRIASLSGAKGPAQTPGALLEELREFGRYWKMSMSDVLDLRYCCSGTMSLMQEYAQLLVGQFELGDDPDALEAFEHHTKRTEKNLIWRPEDDEILMLGTDKERRKLEKRKGLQALENRQNYLRGTGGAVWKRPDRARFPFNKHSDFPL